MALCGQQIITDDPDAPPMYCARRTVRELGVCREHAQPADLAVLYRLIEQRTEARDG